MLIKAILKSVVNSTKVCLYYKVFYPPSGARSAIGSNYNIIKVIYQFLFVISEGMPFQHLGQQPIDFDLPKNKIYLRK